MRRREFIAGLGSAAAWPVVARGNRRIEYGTSVGPCTDRVEVVASREVIWERLPCGGFAFAHLLAC